MADLNILAEKLVSECSFQTSRSQGPGGQNVNKVNTRVELRFSIKESSLLDDFQKERIREKLKNRINNEDELILAEQGSRSQLKNREKVKNRFILLIIRSLQLKKKRIPTRATRSSVEKRLAGKKLLSEKKRLRREF